MECWAAINSYCIWRVPGWMYCWLLVVGWAPCAQRDLNLASLATSGVQMFGSNWTHPLCNSYSGNQQFQCKNKGQCCNFRHMERLPSSNCLWIRHLEPRQSIFLPKFESWINLQHSCPICKWQNVQSVGKAFSNNGKQEEGKYAQYAWCCLVILAMVT